MRHRSDPETWPRCVFPNCAMPVEPGYLRLCSSHWTHNQWHRKPRKKENP